MRAQMFPASKTMLEVATRFKVKPFQNLHETSARASLARDSRALTCIVSTPFS
jgi:hypothetical protein